MFPLGHISTSCALLHRHESNAVCISSDRPVPSGSYQHCLGCCRSIGKQELMHVMRHATGLPSQASTADKAADASPDLDLTPLVDSEPAFRPV